MATENRRVCLDIRDVHKNFGGVAALRGVSITASEGEITSVIGPNGAGKTTLFNLITGLFPPSAGEIYFYEQPLTGRSPEAIATLGIVRTFQNIRLFEGLSVLDNVKIGMHCRLKTGFWDALLATSRWQREERAADERALALLHFVGIQGVANQRAESLPYGLQRRLEIARALAVQPKLLLLDEPAAGMNPSETKDLMELIRKIRDQGTVIVLIEHDMQVVMNISDKVVVLDYGVKIAEGKPKEIREDPRVIEAYLGESL